MRKPRTTLSSIVKAAKIKAQTKIIVRPNSEHLLKQAPKSVNKLI